ncbi:MAG TPA: fasciclin domain-containing protein [Urbifossiella sp.]|nr:fasciclin domain-containing protein [Urbifossiella sp.]
MKAKLFAAVACALLLVLSSGSTAAEDKDIVDIAVGSKDHTILVAAVKEAGLVDVLKGKGPFTVFGPTDAAFKKLGDDKLKAVIGNKALLTKILLAHVVQGKAVTAADAVKMDGKEVNGFKIAATAGGVMIGEAKVTKADLKASNGVIHVIDTVLIPKE